MPAKTRILAVEDEGLGEAPICRLLLGQVPPALATADGLYDFIKTAETVGSDSGQAMPFQKFIFWPALTARSTWHERLAQNGGK